MSVPPHLQPYFGYVRAPSCELDDIEVSPPASPTRVKANNGSSLLHPAPGEHQPQTAEPAIKPQATVSERRVRIDTSLTIGAVDIQQEIEVTDTHSEPDTVSGSIARPLYTSRQGMLDDWKKQLTPEQNSLYERLKNLDTEADVQCKEATVTTDNMDLLKPFCIHWMENHPDMTFGTLAASLNNIGAKRKLRKTRPFKADFLRQQFVGNTVDELYALIQVYPVFIADLAKLEDQESSSGHTATYLVVDSYYKKYQENPYLIPPALQRLKCLKNPYTDNFHWRMVHVQYMLGLLDIDELMKGLAENGEKDHGFSERLMFMANRGDKEALKRFINYYRLEKGYANEKVASKLARIVDIPGMKGNKSWQAYMVEEFMNDHEISDHEPGWYKKLIGKGKSRRFEPGTTAEKRKRNIAELPSVKKMRTAKRSKTDLADYAG